MSIGLAARLRGQGWAPDREDLACALAGGAPRVVHVGGYWRGENDIVRQMMLALGEAGAEVREVATDLRRDLLDTKGRPYDRGTLGPVWLRTRRLLAELFAFRPHAVVLNAGGLAFAPRDAAWLRRRTALLGLAWSEPAVFETTTRHISAGFDLFLSNDPGSVARHRALGANAAEAPFATNPGFWRPLAPDPALACDALVVGRAHADRIEPVRRLLRTVSTRVHGEQWERHGIRTEGFLFGEDLLRALASARVVVVFARGIDGALIFKPQILDFLAAGAVVLTEDWEGLRARLEPGREVATYRDPFEVPEAVARLVADPARRAALAAAGRARVLAEHTWQRAWPRVLGDLAEAVRGRPIFRQPSKYQPAAGSASSR